VSLIRLELPMPPSANVYWRYDKGRVHLSKEAKVFREAVRLAWVLSGQKSLSGRLGVHGYLWFLTVRGDVDNRAKATLDALQHAGVYADDKQVNYVCFERMGKVRPAKLLVEAWEMDLYSDTTIAEFKDLARWEES
jgi:crossover junction endodeoxyribonuclease RusA